METASPHPRPYQVRLPGQAQDRARPVDGDQRGGAGRRCSCSASISASTSRAASPSRCAPSRARSISTSCARPWAASASARSRCRNSATPARALIRVQRQEGNAQCVANADRVMKQPRRRRLERQARPGRDRRRRVHRARRRSTRANWRDAVSRVGLTLQERQLPRGNTNTARIDMTPDQRAEWCQQVAIKLVEDTIGDKYELRGTESVGPKIGAELMHSGVIAVLATLARHRHLRLVPLRMAVRRRRPDRAAARRDLDARPVRAAAARFQPDRARRAADHRRLLDQRHGGDLRPRAREHAALQEDGPDRAAELQHQRDAGPHLDDLGHGVRGGAGAGAVRRAGALQLLDRHAVGRHRRHLFLDLDRLGRAWST